MSTVPELHFKLYLPRNCADGDIIKLMFRMANLEYTEIESIDRDCPNLRGTSIVEQSVLHFDNQTIFGCTAICRQLAWRFGLSGDNSRDDAVVDTICEFFHEALSTINAWNYLKTDTSNQVNVANLCSKYARDKILPVIENFMCSNDDKDIYVIPDKLTWADLMAFSFFTKLSTITAIDFLDEFPRTKNYVSRISSEFKAANCSHN